MVVVVWVGTEVWIGEDGLERGDVVNRHRQRPLRVGSLSNADKKRVSLVELICHKNLRLGMFARGALITATSGRCPLSPELYHRLLLVHLALVSSAPSDGCPTADWGEYLEPGGTELCATIGKAC